MSLKIENSINEINSINSLNALGINISDNTDIIEEVAEDAAYDTYESSKNPGETIGFSEEQKLPITKSKSQVLDFDTLKIRF